jgi:hypothetical protein
MKSQQSQAVLAVTNQLINRAALVKTPRPVAVEFAAMTPRQRAAQQEMTMMLRELVVHVAMMLRLSLELQGLPKIASQSANHAQNKLLMIR